MHSHIASDSSIAESSHPAVYVGGSCADGAIVH